MTVVCKNYHPYVYEVNNPFLKLNTMKQNKKISIFLQLISLFSNDIKRKISNDKVNEIHLELYNKSNNTEAVILSSKERNNLLQSTGFINTKVNKVDTIALYCKQHYSEYRYISNYKMEEICKRHNLKLKRKELYIGDIPDYNLQEVYNFTPYETVYVEKTHGGQTLSNKEYYHKKQEIYSFHICAPSTMFFKEKTVHLPSIIEDDDPIILYPILFERILYWIIVTAWGHEANIEI